MPEPATSITLPRAALHAAMQAVGRIVERRNTIPILGNVLITAGGGELRLKTTDLDIEAEAVLPLPDAELRTTAPAGLLQDILRKLPDGADVNLALTAHDQRLVVRAGRSRFTLQTMPVADFLDISQGDYAAAFSLPAAELAAMIAATEFAISTEETRYYLNGIHWHVEEIDGLKHLIAVATDGHRLALDKVEAPDGATGMPGIIVPRKTVGELRKLAEAEIAAAKAAGGAAMIAIQVSPQKIRAQGEHAGVALVSKLIDGTFPDYRRVVPVANDRRLTVDVGELAAAADRVSSIAPDRGRAIKVSLAEGQATLTVRDQEQGEAVEELDVEYEAPPIDIGFNARYLGDILARIGSDTALALLTDPASPTIWRAREGSRAFFVLMPMRV